MGYPSEEQFEDARRHRAPPARRTKPEPIKTWGWRPFEPSREAMLAAEAVREKE